MAAAGAGGAQVSVSRALDEVTVARGQERGAGGRWQLWAGEHGGAGRDEGQGRQGRTGFVRVQGLETCPISLQNADSNRERESNGNRSGGCVHTYGRRGGLCSIAHEGSAFSVCRSMARSAEAGATGVC